MPIEIRIDVIPHGVEAARQQIGTIRIVQVKKSTTTPRLYAVSGARSSHVRHRRGDGAARLVALALASDQGLEPAGAEERRD